MSEKNKAGSIVDEIPGGWYGNDPGAWQADPLQGSVTIDGGRVAQAVEWLRRRAVILATRVSEDLNPGVMIVYRIKG